jgi:hypothetical protein
METRMADVQQGLREREFHITVQGRMLEHLGGQMYKRRHLAIAELVANSWDAGATTVDVEVLDPEGAYDPASSTIVITDSGCGMTEDQVETQYLVVGRNRRAEEGTAVVRGRRVMGRKGIGKLAGFGIARTMTLVTWRDGQMTETSLNVDEVKKPVREGGPVTIPGMVGPKDPALPGRSGTRVILQDLKHKTPLDLEALRRSLARRYSRTARGAMTIRVNSDEIEEPEIEWAERFPEEGYTTVTLRDGNEIKYRYGFSKPVLSDNELQGFTVFVNNKTAQAPPFFFLIERTASGQHGTRYLSGEVHADFLDEGLDDESDIVSTDRQEIDWEHEKAAALLEWGDKTTRKALRDWADRHGEHLENWILAVPEFKQRIDRLDPVSQKQLSRFLQDLGKGNPNPERAKDMADALIKAFEYRQFHDVVGEIRAVADDPEGFQTLLQHLIDWKVLESRTMLEIIRGRIEIVEKFHTMIVEDAAETAGRVGDDNMHDLLAQYPWLLNPEWQMLDEEKAVSTRLRQMVAQDERIPEETARLRYDFLALSDERRLVVVEIKRSGHPVRLEELQRLDRLVEALAKAEDREIHTMLVYGGNLDLSPKKREMYDDRDDLDLVEWRDVYARVKRHYEHYRAVLEGDIAHPGFGKKEAEIRRTRDVRATGSVYRGRERRREGVAPSDVEYEIEASPIAAPTSE